MECWGCFGQVDDDLDLGHSCGVGGGLHSVLLFGEDDVVVVHDSNTLQRKRHRTQLLHLHVVGAVVVRALHVDQDNRAVLTGAADILLPSHRWDETPDRLDSNIRDGTMSDDQEGQKEGHCIHTHHLLRVDDLGGIVLVPHFQDKMPHWIH